MPWIATFSLAIFQVFALDNQSTMLFNKLCFLALIAISVNCEGLGGEVTKECCILQLRTTRAGRDLGEGNGGLEKHGGVWTQGSITTGITVAIVWL